MESARNVTRILALGFVCLLTDGARSAEIVDPGQGPFDIVRERSGATGLSGITYLGGNRFLAVSDHGRRLFPLEVRIDSRTGKISSVGIERGALLANTRDTEGIAFSGRDTVFVCDEVGPALREHRIEDGAVVRALSVPTIFSRARRNMSLEGLTRGPDGSLWIANEEALSVDGSKSTEKRGTWVRLQRLEERPQQTRQPNWEATGQWAYRTDPIPGHPIGGWERSGVVDLAALPDGQLLVLERGLGSRGLRSRIYEVDLGSATDTGDISNLNDAPVAAVGKRLLWEAEALGDNFEGIALGPPLADGDRSLILISDDGSATLPRLYALRVRTRGAENTQSGQAAATRTPPRPVLGSPGPPGPPPPGG
jgi:hypothetical protein